MQPFRKLEVECTPIPQVELDSKEARDRVERGEPFVARVHGWRALEWDVEYLKRVVGAKILTVDRRSGGTKDMPLAEYVDLVADASRLPEFELPTGPLIRIQSPDGVDPELAPLARDIQWPSYVRPEKISSINIWVSSPSSETGSVSHAEPNAMTNLNLQVRGKKHVRLFPPDDARCLSVPPSVCYPPFVAAGQMAYRISENPRFAEVRAYETVLEAGMAIHIPAFWFHWFEHYPAYQINLNVWWETDRMPLHPISANWAYLNALCTALGGFDEQTTVARFEALPEETKALLRAIEDNLLNKPSLLRPLEMLAARLGKP
jgi:hypothetical protein